MVVAMIQISGDQLQTDDLLEAQPNTAAHKLNAT